MRLRSLKAIISDYLLFPRLHIVASRNKFPPESFFEGDKGHVVLIPGYMEKWYFLSQLGYFMNEKGFKVHILEKLPTITKSIEACHNLLEEKLKEESLENVILIGHSKGGLIAKYFMNNSQESWRVKKIITIATPYKGTYLGLVRIFYAYEFLPESRLLQELESQKEHNHHFLNFYARRDSIVTTQENLILENAQNHMIDMIGHINILYSDALRNKLEEVMSEIIE